MNVAYNMDCLEAMRQMPDKAFDLACCDPPYGDGNAGIGGGVRFGGRFDRYKVETVQPQRTSSTIRSEGGQNEQEELGQKSTVKKS